MIKKMSELDAIFKKKLSVGNKHFSIYYDFKPVDHLHYAISIGKKYGNAVERNLAKRRLRHVVYLHSDLENDKFAFVIVVKPAAAGLTFEEIDEQISNLLIKIKNKQRNNT